MLLLVLLNRPLALVDLLGHGSPKGLVPVIDQKISNFTNLMKQDV